MRARSLIVVRDAYAEVRLSDGSLARIDIADIPLVDGRLWHRREFKRGHSYAVGGAMILMHRLIAGAGKGEQVDHADNDGLNNRRNNLRLCTHAENCRNTNKRPGCSSRFKGVSLTRSGKYQAQIEKNGTIIRLGTFRDEEKAARQYDSAARVLFGRFAKTNEMLGLLPH